MIVRNAPEKLSKKMNSPKNKNSSPKNKKRKAMNYRPYEKTKVYSQKMKNAKSGLGKKENPI